MGQVFRLSCVGLLLMMGVAAVQSATPAAAVAAGIHLSGCGKRVAVLGADMSPGGRFEVQRALKVGPHTVQLDETVAEERVAAHGLVPPGLLGSVAVSSALLHPLPAGSGLTVVLNPAITLHTAQTYANALLTAGVTDAEVGVAAPTSQRALGTTALLGLLRAAGVACLSLSPSRQDLAIREVVLSGELARQVGRPAAPALLFALKSDAAARGLTAPAALSALITRDAAARGLAVPEVLRTGLIAFLRDLVANGGYASVARAHPTMSQAAPLQTTVHLAGTVAAPRRPAAPGGKKVHAVGGARAVSRAGIWRGTVVAVSTSGIAARLGDGVHKYLPAPGLLVYRNGEASSLPALQPGDAITVTTDAAGLATTVQAAGAPAVARPAHAAPAPAPGSDALNVAGISALVALILLALLLAPPLVGLVRRRRARVRT